MASNRRTRPRTGRVVFYSRVGPSLTFQKISSPTTIVGAPKGQRPFRTVIDPADDGSAVSFAVIDRLRGQFLHRIGFADLLRPAP